MTRCNFLSCRTLSATRPERNYVAVRFLMHHDVSTIFQSSAVMNATRILPERHHSYFADGTGNSLALTYLDSRHIDSNNSLVEHAIIGYVSNRCGMTRDNMNEFMLRQDDVLKNNAFIQYFHFCYREWMKENYHHHTKMIDFRTLSDNDYIRCIVLDGRIQPLILDRFAESDDLFPDPSQGNEIIQRWYEKESKGEDIVAMFDVDRNNGFVEDSYIKGDAHQILSSQNLGFSQVPREVLVSMQMNTYTYDRSV